MKRSHTIALAVIVALLLGVGWKLLSPDSIHAVTVTYYNSDRPTDAQTPLSFDLTEQELEEFNRLCPDLTQGTARSGAVPVPPFRLEIHYSSGMTIRATAWAGLLATQDPWGYHDVPSALGEILVRAIASRAGELDWKPGSYPAPWEQLVHP